MVKNVSCGVPPTILHPLFSILVFAFNALTSPPQRLRSLIDMFRVTRHGFKEMLIGSVVLALMAMALGWAWWPLALLALPVLVWLFAFFRDPERVVPTEDHLMVSPADGTISDITQIEHDEDLGGPAVRVGIFLSVFS